MKVIAMQFTFLYLLGACVIYLEDGIILSINLSIYLYLSLSLFIYLFRLIIFNANILL